ncbi:MAG: type II toxin-antitoxin system VapB family antitoxin [Thiolinea sp.]
MLYILLFIQIEHEKIDQMTQTTLAKVFTSGNSQAIRLPKQFRLDVKEVYIRWSGNNLVIMPRPDSWDGFMEGSTGFSDDFSTNSDELPADVERRGFD